MNGHSNAPEPGRQPPARSGPRRAEILDAARDVLRERGFHATRLADVGERLGLTAPAVAYHFPSRTELLAEALLSTEQRYYLALEPLLEQRESAGARLGLVAGSGLAGTDWVLWLELCALALRDETARAGLERLERRWHGLLEALLAEGEQRGEWVLRAPAAEVAAGLAALLDGLGVQLVLRGLAPETAAGAARHALAAELGVELDVPLIAARG